ncbi:MAG: hypothetical protein WBB01_06430 [Phormidesmis sp.]
MTPREQLIQEIEQAPEATIEELLDFLLLAKMRHFRQPERERSFSAFIEELVADIPPEVLGTLPTDSAAEHDHYIYDTRKKGTQRRDDHN